MHAWHRFGVYADKTSPNIFVYSIMGLKLMPRAPPPSPTPSWPTTVRRSRGTPAEATLSQRTSDIVSANTVVHAMMLIQYTKTG